MMSRMLCRPAARFMVQRYLSTGEAAISQPLHFINGQRVEPSNPDPAHDFEVIEPATGNPCTNAVYKNI